MPRENVRPVHHNLSDCDAPSALGGRPVAAWSYPGKDSSVDFPQTKYAKTVDGLRVALALVAGSGLAFEDAGEHGLKGVPERWHLYRVAE
jgi:hypothetical protein